MNELIKALQALMELPKTLEELKERDNADIRDIVKSEVKEYCEDNVPDFGDISNKYDLEQMIDDEIDSKMDDTDFIRGEDLPCDIYNLATSESVRELEERVDNLESGSGLHDSVVEMAKTVDAIRENIRRMRDALTAALGE